MGAGRSRGRESGWALSLDDIQTSPERSLPIHRAFTSGGHDGGRHSRRSEMNRRFGFLWIWGLGTAAIAAVVGAIAYHAGQTATVVTTAPGGSEVIYRGYDGFGFFPFFGLFWLLLIGFFVFRLFAWRSWGRGPWGYGDGNYKTTNLNRAQRPPKSRLPP